MATDAENEALELIRRTGALYVRGEPMTAEYAADKIVELAARIKAERAQAEKNAGATPAPDYRLTGRWYR